MDRAALLSVSDKKGIGQLGLELQRLGFTVLSTSGTARTLIEAGVDVYSIEDYTGQPEILDGRVKTLHPKIHAGLLARRDSREDLAELARSGILPIEVAVINLYPFEVGLQSDRASDPQSMTELIDVGGPTMIRAAAKNFLHVLPLVDPADYKAALGYLVDGKVPLSFKCEMATKVFTRIAQYNMAIAQYMSRVGMELDDDEEVEALGKLAPQGLENPLTSVSGQVWVKSQELRYGENPHQAAVVYRELGDGPRCWEQLAGKELSYNNLLDFDATLSVLRNFLDDPTAVIVKHLNPCGMASAETLVEALRRAKCGDPRSHFGGIIGFNTTVGQDVAEEIRDGFVEIVLAPDYEDAALDLLRKRKNLRIIRVNLQSTALGYEFRSIEGGVLCQQRDLVLSSLTQAQNTTGAELSESQQIDLEFAWKLCQGVKSNAIVLVKDHMLLASGAGQMSRIDATEVALMKANTHQHDLHGAVAASDAFFPFPDSLEKLAEAGISAIVTPGGAKRDDDVVQRARELGVGLFFTRDRHFRH